MNRILQLRLCVTMLLLLSGLCAFWACKKDPPSDDSQLKDFDGNIYTSVIIGSQEWMVQDLKTTHYRNGDEILTGVESTEWKDLTAGAFCNYNGDAGLVATYGRLYNWFAVTDPRGLCPAGWHVPTKDEWDTLMNFLGGQYVAGGKLKEADTVHWDSPNIDATNETGFTALPCGTRNYSSAQYIGLGNQVHFWADFEHLSNTTRAARFYIFNYQGILQMDYGDKNFGNSVRCLRD